MDDLNNNNVSNNLSKEEKEDLAPQFTTYKNERSRVFLISDVHTDESGNYNSVLKNFKGEEYNKETDFLILAGDISQDEEVIRETFQRLRPAFKELLFCPGNNELRIRKKDLGSKFHNSIEKFHHVLKICEEEDVRTGPVQCGSDVTIVPLFSWYEPSFNPNWDHSTHYQKQWLDFYKINWPQEFESDLVDGAVKYFLKLNEDLGRIRTYDTQYVISFSHFMPRFELCPPSFFTKKTFPNVIGSKKIDEQIRSIKSNIHCFGHTHISLDKTISGVRYLQHACGHPAEQSKFWYSGGQSPKLIYQTGTSPSSSSCMIQ